MGNMFKVTNCDLRKTCGQAALAGQKKGGLSTA